MLRTVAAHPATPWLWAGLSVAGWIASLFVALPIAATVGADLAGRGLRWDLGLYLALIGILSMAGAILIGRRLLGGMLNLTVGSVAASASGVVLAIAQELALHAWGSARFGYYDRDLIGWTAGLSFLVTLVALGTLGVAVAPRRAVGAPFLGLAAAGGGTWLVALSNIPGLRTGIPTDALPLAITIGLCAAYPIVGLAVGVRRLLST